MAPTCLVIGIGEESNSNHSDGRRRKRRVGGLLSYVEQTEAEDMRMTRSVGTVGGIGVEGEEEERDTAEGRRRGVRRLRNRPASVGTPWSGQAV